MKRSSSVFSQTVVVLFGVAVLAFLLWEPTIEGRNAHATFFDIYFKDTFLACAYIASTPFFVAVYQAFKLFGDAGRDGKASARSLSRLRTIKYCALITIGFILVGEACLALLVRGTDDIAGGVAMGVLVGSFFAIAAAAATFFERSLRTSLSA